jgi:hypothetical protein
LRGLFGSHVGEGGLLTLVRRHRSVGEEEPLQALVAFQFVLEAVGVLLVGELEQVEQLCRCLHDGEGRVLGVVDDDWDAAVWVEFEEPCNGSQ